MFSKIYQNIQNSHAFLFHGGSSDVNFNFALNLAKSLNCKEKQGEGFCDNCNICKTISNLTYPDLIITSKDSDKKELTENKIGNLTQKGSFIYKIYNSSLSSSFKVGIIKDFHLANNTAQNAILKCLEEPPKDTIIILIADNLGGIKDTIISRCQLYEFPVPKKEDIYQFLSSSFSDSQKEESIDFIMSDFSLISKFKDTEENLNFYKDSIKNFSSLCFSTSSAEKIKYYNKISQDIKKNTNFNDYIHIWEVFFDKLLNKNYKSLFFKELFSKEYDIKLEKNLLNLYNVKEGYLKNLNTNILLFEFILNI
ncbi:hypothetical protein K9M42_02690 [Patescibacteria group bacterium]|nr:hypothetical protein [Patescibacteria group bacterium]